MKTLLALFALCLGASLPLSGASASAAADLPLRVMSFNIRQSSARDGANGWSFRRELFLQNVTKFDPALVGFQEVLADQYDELSKHLAGYTLVGVAGEDGRRKGEWALIAYRSARFEALDSGNFWLSEQPEVPNSMSWNTANTRICTWVRLRERANGREFVYANTHFDHKSALARRHSGALIATRLASIAKGAPVILSGDFNMTEDDPSFLPLFKPQSADALAFSDSYREVHPTRTPEEASFHGFKGGTTGSRIDFIFHTAQFVATAAEIDRTVGPDGKYPSDHYAVTAILRWK